MTMDDVHAKRYDALAAAGVDVLPARGKSLADPETAPAGSWDVLSGVLGRAGWLRSGEPWKALTDAEREASYSTHALVYACVRRLYVTAAEADLRVGVYKGEGREWADEHPLTALLAEPNAHYSGMELTQYLVARLMLTGRAYLWKWRNNGRRVGELWPVPTSWVTEIAGTGNTPVSGCRVAQGNGATVYVPAADMVCIRSIDPASTAGGASAFAAAGVDYDADVERARYLREYMTNAPLPGVKVRTEKSLTMKQRGELRESLNDQAGRGKRGSPIVLEGGLDAEIIDTARDMDWPGLTALAESRICAAFGVPPILVGARVGLDRSTFANYGEARTSFYADTMRPLWRQMETALTRGLLRAEGDTRAVLEYDTGHIRELQESDDAKATRARANYQSGIATLNEAREAAGLPPVVGPDGEAFKPVGLALPVGVPNGA